MWRGFYSTEDTPSGICVQLDVPHGPVQIYPSKLFEYDLMTDEEIAEFIEENGQPDKTFIYIKPHEDSA